MNAQKASPALADRGPEDSSLRSLQAGAWSVCSAYWPYLSLLSMSWAFALGTQHLLLGPKSFCIWSSLNIPPRMFFPDLIYLRTNSCLPLPSQVKYPFPQQTLSEHPVRDPSLPSPATLCHITEFSFLLAPYNDVTSSPLLICWLGYGGCFPTPSKSRDSVCLNTPLHPYVLTLSLAHGGCSIHLC